MLPNGAERPVQVTFRKASFCGSTECVEVGQRDDLVILRDSAQPNGFMLHCTVDEWRSFVRNIKTGSLGRLR
jgi:uncharacterized protein DUF397